jgi:hypothetical protein
VGYKPCCENFLYVFKAARRAARAAAAAASPALPLRRAGQPVGWRETKTLFPGPPYRSVVRPAVQLGDQDLDVDGSRSVIVRGRPEPVKGAFGVGFAADP